ncbi:hypothetical protein SAMN05216316_1834 [Nitrosovibrio sp. Nv6]|nr:hypothetical protein SAMN05216316_1834 [Nitrosovibrio sp. Nv6]
MSTARHRHYNWMQFSEGTLEIGIRFICNGHSGKDNGFKNGGEGYQCHNALRVYMIIILSYSVFLRSAHLLRSAEYRYISGLALIIAAHESLS